MYHINNSDFQILSKYKNYLKVLEDALENVPRKDLYFKDLIRNKSYEILQYILECSYEEDTVKVLGYRTSIRADIAMVDFLIDRMYDKAYISEKMANKLSLLLIEINKMILGLISNLVRNEC